MPEIPTKIEEAALNLFWGNDRDSLNFFAELTKQERTKDVWYNALLEECRQGVLSEDNFNFLLGLPTRQLVALECQGHRTLPKQTLPVASCAVEKNCRKRS